MPTQRQQSKKDWESSDTSEDIRIGCLQRIADATELMATNYLKLQSDVEMYKRWYKEASGTIAYRDKQISAIRGQITKLKNKLKRTTT